MEDQQTEPKKLSRIQQRNRELIIDAALDVFSQHGFRGATLDQIAESSGLSKPNILYYFAGKEDIYVTLLNQMLSSWSDPLQALKADGDPITEILAYVDRKMDMTRAYPRESRLFANEIIQGGSRVMEHLQADVKALFDEKVAVIQGWVDAGRLAPVDPRHLITSIWATTQHYADFDAQIQVLLGPGDQVIDQGTEYLTTLFAKALKPEPQAAE
ncbi:transcriptional regulator, TetR family [Cognatishimia maritima]|uniref:Transcriptional regulator, TetR family n=2 Tax=Cognatishimia maritima TaxID=870908 RepID=A0A1M5L7S1_9RHOB|nr:TetR family transcriptional regulator C-terminal domain-containing protein [Cognatishimia maritima]SHG61068.1 transcriptional regulator, TetR family [Cognatishimia maritima]